MVPKYVAVTPNDKYVVVTNWCSWTVSIVNEATHHLVATIPVGAIRAVSRFRPTLTSPTSRSWFGRDRRHQPFDLQSRRTDRRRRQRAPRRHRSQNPDFLYASLNIPGDVVKINRLTGRILAEVHTGSDCRSFGDLDRRHGALRRELSLQHGDRVSREQSQDPPSRADRHQSGRGHLRRHHGTSLGRGLHRRDTVFNTKP